jgi:hypothetical protein
MRLTGLFAAVVCAPLLIGALAAPGFAGDDSHGSDYRGNEGGGDRGHDHHDNDDRGGDHDGHSGNKGVKPIKHFPEPETFTKRLYTVPNPFISWEGSDVRPRNWPARTAQFKQIIQHYETGYMPSTEGITVSLEVTKPQSSYTLATGAGTAQVIVYKDGIAAEHKINISFFLPDPADPNFPPPRKGYPVVLNTGTSVAGFSDLRACGFRSGILPRLITRAGGR